MASRFLCRRISTLSNFIARDRANSQIPYCLPTAMPQRWVEENACSLNSLLRSQSIFFCRAYSSDILGFDEPDDVSQDADLEKFEIAAQTARKKLTFGHHRKKGRSAGRITSWHKGGGHKRLYRVIDFTPHKRGPSGTIVAMDYDPNRRAKICLVRWDNYDPAQNTQKEAVSQ